MIIERRITLEGPEFTDGGRVEITIAHNGKVGSRAEAEEAFGLILRGLLAKYRDLSIDASSVKS